MAIVSRLMPNTARKSTVHMPAVDCLILLIAANLRCVEGVRLVIGDAANAVDDGLAALIARAIATRDMFLSGSDDSIDAMAIRLGVRRDYLAVLVRLSVFVPHNRRAVLAGHQPVELTPTRLVALSRNLPHDWREQWRVLDLRPSETVSAQSTRSTSDRRKPATETLAPSARRVARIFVSGGRPL